MTRQYRATRPWRASHVCRNFKHPVTSASPNSISVEPLQLPDRNLTVNDSVQ